MDGFDSSCVELFTDTTDNCASKHLRLDIVYVLLYLSLKKYIYFYLLFQLSPQQKIYKKKKKQSSVVIL